MKLQRVAVLGGGPGGLYVARLLKLAQPDCEVDLHEQGTAETTFGFGVGLAAGTQRNLRTADPDSLADILERGHPHDMSLRVGDAVAHMPDDTLRAIARSTLLAVLQDHARAAGVVLHLGERPVAAELDADLVIAADGINSATRDAPGVDFGTRIEVGEGLYLWCGTDVALPSALFMPVTTEAGTFVTHAYPYAADRSTFLIETDGATWRAAGFDVTTEALTTAAPDASDEVSLRYLEQAFAGPLQGHPLIGNRTRWLRFRTVSCARWHDGNVVLLGDAAHTAHYSIGSGTKLAMEDAIALVAAIGAHDNVPDALVEYETVRRPAVEHLQDVAGRSQRWWDTFPDRLDVPINQLLVAYMTRAGKVPLPRFAESTPEVVRAALAEFAGEPAPDDVLDDIEKFVLTRPGARGDVEFDDRVTPLPAGVTVRLDGPHDRDAVLDRLDRAEELRRQQPLPVTVVGPEEHLPDLVAGLVAARTDLIEVTPRA